MQDSESKNPDSKAKDSSALDPKSRELLDSFIHYIRFEQNLSENTQVSYLNDLKTYLTYLKSQGIAALKADQHQISEYLWARKRKGLEVSTLCRELESIRMF